MYNLLTCTCALQQLQRLQRQADEYRRAYEESERTHQLRNQVSRGMGMETQPGG